MLIPLQLNILSLTPFLVVFLFIEVSPASSSSGNFSQFTPDSATSPHSSSSSPQPTAKSQKGREYGMEGMRRTKSRTAFSKEQLQTLHQRFQSQKYLSPQQIRELAVALGLTYKQVNRHFYRQCIDFTMAEWSLKEVPGWKDESPAGTEAKVPANSCSPAYSCSEIRSTFADREVSGTSFGPPKLEVS